MYRVARRFDPTRETTYDAVMVTSITPQIVRVEKLYDAGDYKQARKLARTLLAEGEMTASHRQRLEKVLAATGTDNVAVMAIVFTLCVLVFLVVKYGF